MLRPNKLVEAFCDKNVGAIAVCLNDSRAVGERENLQSSTGMLSESSKRIMVERIQSVGNSERQFPQTVELRQIYVRE